MSLKASENINEVLEPEKEEKMNEGIDRDAKRVSNSDFEEADGMTVGVETEYFILNGEDQPIMEGERDEIIGKDSYAEGLENWDHELGASMAETASEPVRGVQSLEEVEEVIRKPEEEMVERLQGTEYHLLRNGSNPNQDLEEVERTSEPKYVEVPDAYGEMRRNFEDEPLDFSEDLDVERMTEEFGNQDTIDPRNADIPATISSTQLNVQADNIDDAIEKANIGYAIAPYVTALSGNSRFVNGKDLGFNDTRLELWEKSFDIGNFEKDDIDIGKIDEYFQDFDDYIERIREQPRIVNDESRETIDGEWQEKVESAPLDVGQGMYWKDSRIKVIEGSEVKDELIVEFRQNSTQPTAREDAAVHAFYMGRMAYEQEAGPDLLDIEKVNHNRYSAMRDGLDSDLYDWDTGTMRDSEEVLQNEIEKAREGLEYAGIEDPGYLEVLEDRLNTGLTPADEIAEIYGERVPDEESFEGDYSKAKREAAMEAVKSVNMIDYDQRVQTV